VQIDIALTSAPSDTKSTFVTIELCKHLAVAVATKYNMPNVLKEVKGNNFKEDAIIGDGCTVRFYNQGGVSSLANMVINSKHEMVLNLEGTKAFCGANYYTAGMKNRAVTIFFIHQQSNLKVPSNL
jgi:hypothetical protein